MSRSMRSGNALLLIGLQRDFFAGGAAPAPGADEIIPLVNDWIAAAQPADVPTFGGNSARTGVMPGPGPSGQPQIRWTFACWAAADGVVYFASGDGSVHAMAGDPHA